MGTFPSTPILDNFNRADEGPPPSASWTAINSPGFQVSANQLAPVDNGDNYALWTATFNANQEVYWTVSTVQLSGSYSTIFARLYNNAGVFSGYLMEHFSQTAGSTETLYLGRIDSNAFTQLGPSVSLIVGAGDTWGMRCVGSSIEAWYKTVAGRWSQLVRVMDTTYNGDSPYNQIGAYHYGAIAGTVPARWDNFGGGSIVYPSFQAQENGGRGVRPRAFAPGLAR